MKKLILILGIMILGITGCITEEGKNLDSSYKESEQVIIDESDEQKRGPHEITGDKIDNSIILELTSKPSESNAPTTVEFQYKASQEGYSASDFEYTYELQGVESLEVDGLTDVYKFVEQINKKFYNLENGSSHTFQVWARNKVTGKISPSVIHSFNIKNISTDTSSENITLTYIRTNKESVDEGEDINVILGISNSGDEELEVIPSIIFNTTSVYNESINENSRFESLSETEMVTVPAGGTVKVEKSYNIQQGTVDGSAIDKPFYTIAKIKVPSTGKVSDTSNYKFRVYANGKMNIKINEASVLSSSVSPGEQGVKIRYSISTSNNASVLIKNISPIITRMDGTDVSEEWVDTSPEEKIVSGIAYVTRTYNISSNATPGDMMVDAMLNGIGPNNTELTASNAEEGDQVTVLNRGIGSLDLWIAYPEGAVDGVVSEDQTFTVYGKVKYNGDVRFSDNGEVELNVDDLDGVRIASGNAKQQIKMNEQMEWTIKAGRIPIEGNINLKINRFPVERETESKIDFESSEANIPLQVIQKSELKIEPGIEEDNYGGKDGVLRDDDEFKVYAIAKNVNSNAVDGEVKMELDLSGINGIELAPGESFIKTGQVDSKIIWTLRTPIGNKTGSLRFNLQEVPKDENTGENINYQETETLGIKVKHPGELNLREVYCDWVDVDPGSSRIPIKFVIENKGDTEVKLNEVQAEFTQRGENLSEKWTLTDSTIYSDTVIDPNTVKTITGYYKLQENMLDDSDILGEVTISGLVRGEELISKEILEDLEPRMDDKIIVNDTVPPVAVINVDATEATVGEELTFNGTDSTDNNEIRYYSWDFDDSDGIVENVRGEVVNHTYDEPGNYRVTLTVNDMDGNGPSEDQILIKVTEE